MRKILLFLLIVILCSCSSQNIKLGIINDIHGNNGNVVYFLDEFRQNNVDAIIVNGDIVDILNNVSDYNELYTSLSILAESGIPVFVVPGNHERKEDYYSVMENLSDSKNLHDLSKESLYYFKGILFAAISGYYDENYTVKDGFIYSKEDVDNLFKDIVHTTGKFIFISHGSPKGILDDIYSGKNVGDEKLNAIAERAFIGIFAHIHEAGGKAVDNKGNVVAQDVFADSFYLNPGPATVWKMNNGEITNGNAAIVEIKGDKARYRIIKR